MSIVWLRELCMLLVVLLQHATIIHSSADSGDAIAGTMTGAETRNNNTTTATAVQREEEAYGLLRGSSFSAGSIQHMERIVDKDALSALNGADPASSQFKYHPPGHEANFWDYPFFAHWTHAECGATVVHDDILLTAGHCGRKATEPHWRKSVRLLSKFRRSEGIERAVAYLKPHPKFFQPQQVYDFQLIKTQSSVLSDTQGNPTGVQLVRSNDNFNNPAPGDVLQAVGFGTVVPDAHTGNSEVLMDITLQAFANDHCASQYGGNKIKEDVMVCVGEPSGTRDTCQGDSGGPMLDTRNVQVGVISWGKGCADADHAGLASRVSTVADWIAQEICNLSAMPPSTCGDRNFPTTSYDNRLPRGTDDDKGQFSMRVTVQHDNGPKETSWSLTHLESATLMYWQPFYSVPEPFVDVSHVFHDLVAGTYVFAISDTNKDGICCVYGQGSIAITNHGTNQLLWQHRGDFKDYLGVTLTLDTNGAVVSQEESTDWINPSLATTMANGEDGHLGDPSSAGSNEKFQG